MPLPAVAVFDLETTGVDPSPDRIVSAYVGVLDSTGAITSGQGAGMVRLRHPRRPPLRHPA